MPQLNERDLFNFLVNLQGETLRDDEIKEFTLAMLQLLSAKPLPKPQRGRLKMARDTFELLYGGRP